MSVEIKIFSILNGIFILQVFILIKVMLIYIEMPVNNQF